MLDIIGFLREFCGTESISGFERRAHEKAKALIKPFFGDCAETVGRLSSTAAAPMGGADSDVRHPS